MVLLNKVKNSKKSKLFHLNNVFKQKKATDGYPNCFIINLKNKISNINILGFTIKFENSNPCYGYMIADWCLIHKRLKLYDVDGYVTQMY